MDEPLEIVTIDGPSGVGKSTVSRKVAAIIGFTYLDTGAMYRAAGWYLQQRGVDPDDEDAIALNLQNFELQLFPGENDGCDVRVVVNGHDVSDAVRTPQMAMVASRVSALSAVRRVLTDIQRGFGDRGRIVAEGRDTGTVVFPEARYKFFLDARVDERARRRVEQLQSRGLAPDPEEILEMTVLRDKNDTERQLAPLRQAADAVRIDTTTMTIDEVVETIVRGVTEKQH